MSVVGCRLSFVVVVVVVGTVTVVDVVDAVAVVRTMVAAVDVVVEVAIDVVVVTVTVYCCRRRPSMGQCRHMQGVHLKNSNAAAEDDSANIYDRLW